MSHRSRHHDKSQDHGPDGDANASDRNVSSDTKSGALSGNLQKDGYPEITGSKSGQTDGSSTIDTTADKRSAKHKVENIVQLKGNTPEERFDEVMSPSGKPKVIDFYFDGCKWCTTLKKSELGPAERRYGNKVDFIAIDLFDEKNAKLIEHFAVTSYPTLLYFDSTMTSSTQTTGYVAGDLDRQLDWLFSIEKQAKRSR